MFRGKKLRGDEVSRAKEEPKGEKNAGVQIKKKPLQRKRGKIGENLETLRDKKINCRKKADRV